MQVLEIKLALVNQSAPATANRNNTDCYFHMGIGHRSPVSSSSVLLSHRSNNPQPPPDVDFVALYTMYNDG